MKHRIVLTTKDISGSGKLNVVILVGDQEITLPQRAVFLGPRDVAILGGIVSMSWTIDILEEIKDKENNKPKIISAKFNGRQIDAEIVWDEDDDNDNNDNNEK